jgi:hypothetical protein
MGLLMIGKNMLHGPHFGRWLHKRLTRLAAMSGMAATLCPAEFTIHRVSHYPLHIRPADLGGVVTYGPDAAVYFLHTGNAVVHRISDGDGALVRIPLEPAAESATAVVNLMADMAVDATGQMFIPAMWTRKPKGGGAGVLVYTAAGHYERTIVLAPQVNIRHLAMDPAGNIFVLGIDPSYYKGLSNLCLLIHKYAPDGTRISAFSGCPIPAGDRSLGPQWERLSFEVDRGSIWIQDGRLYHALPSSRAVRVFDPNTGIAIGETLFEPPPVEGVEISASGTSDAWRVLPRGHDAYLVVWSVRTGVGRNNFVAAHDRKGSPVTTRISPMREGMPVASASNGQVFFLAPQPDGTVTLVRGVVQIE